MIVPESELTAWPEQLIDSSQNRTAITREGRTFTPPGPFFFMEDARMIWITRTWKRDGSTNLMELAEAEKNLDSHGLHLAGASPRDVLLRGGVLETPLAFFSRGSLGAEDEAA